MAREDKLINWFGFSECPAWAVSVTRSEDDRVWYWDAEVNRLIDLSIDLRAMDDSAIQQVYELGIRCACSSYYYCGPDSGPDKLDRPAVLPESESAEDEENPVAKELVGIFTGETKLEDVERDPDSLVPPADEVFPASEDNVNHPSHYTSHPSGIECIQITAHHDFCIGNAIKYLWRAGLKQDPDKTELDKEVEDLRKAIWYINYKIDLLIKSEEN